LAAIGTRETTVWQVRDARLRWTFATELPVRGAFDPAGDKLLVLSRPAAVFDLTSGERLRTWDHMVRGFWAGGDRLILVRADGRIATFDLGRAEPLATATMDARSPAAYDPTSATLAVSDGAGVQLLGADLTPIRRWSFGAARIGPLASSADGRTLLFGLGLRQYAAWRPATSDNPHLLGDFATMRSRAAVDPNGRFGVAMSGFESRLWRLDGSAASATGPDAPGFALTAGGTLILGDDDRRLASIDVARCLRVAPPNGCGAATLLAADAPAARTVAAAPSGFKGRYWPRFEIGVAGRRLAVQRDRGFDVVDLAGPSRTLRVTAGATAGGLAIDRAGTVVARADHDRVRLWQLPGGRELAPLPTAGMNGVWLAGDDRAVVASDDGAVIEGWDWKRRKRLWRRELGQPTRYQSALAGRYLLRPNVDRGVALIDIDSGETAARLWIERADSWLLVAADGRVDSSPEPPPMLSWRAGDVVLPGFVGLQRNRAPLRRELFGGDAR
jgi:hypothetical protein